MNDFSLRAVAAYSCFEAFPVTKFFLVDYEFDFWCVWVYDSLFKVIERLLVSVVIDDDYFEVRVILVENGGEKVVSCLHFLSLLGINNRTYRDLSFSLAKWIFLAEKMMLFDSFFYNLGSLRLFSRSIVEWLHISIRENVKFSLFCEKFRIFFVVRQNLIYLFLLIFESVKYIRELLGAWFVFLEDFFQKFADFGLQVRHFFSFFLNRRWKLNWWLEANIFLLLRALFSGRRSVIFWWRWRCMTNNVEREQSHKDDETKDDFGCFLNGE